jgi:hypothetical protein
MSASGICKILNKEWFYGIRIWFKC